MAACQAAVPTTRGSNQSLKRITKLLAANRSEIAIRTFCSAHELGIRTVAVYSHEDRYALHRFKADEAYPIGRPGEPVRAYLDVEGILTECRQHGVDAIHPGYGYLSENPELARACQREGITWVGPRVELLKQLGDKIAAREIARSVGVPVQSGSSKPIRNLEDARRTAERLGYPVILKASHGGGGRGMRSEMLAKLTRWLEAGLPVKIPLVTLLKARQRHQSVGLLAKLLQEIPHFLLACGNHSASRRVVDLDHLLRLRQEHLPQPQLRVSIS